MPIWRLLKRESAPLTADFYVAALDMQFGPNGDLKRVPDYARVYIPLFIRTAWMSTLITVLTLVLGYPLAYWISRMPERRANVMMIAVLLPFWTSLLVRITAWIVLLQSHGVINSLLVGTQLVAGNARPQLIDNGFGTVVVMTQVLLPFMVLPLYSVMRGIPDQLSAGGHLARRASLAGLLAGLRAPHAPGSAPGRCSSSSWPSATTSRPSSSAARPASSSATASPTTSSSR